MKIIITGNLGYDGPSVILQLRKSYPNAQLIGIDIGIFAHCLTGVIFQPEACLDAQIYKDVRDLSVSDFEDVDAVIHLAAISNDPMGKTFERITDEINHQSSKEEVGSALLEMQRWGDEGVVHRSPLRSAGPWSRRICRFHGSSTFKNKD